MTAAPSLLQDARELIALMRGRAENPLLEQWQLISRSKDARRPWWFRLAVLLQCCLPSYLLLWFIRPPNIALDAVTMMLLFPPMFCLGVMVAASQADGASRPTRQLIATAAFVLLVAYPASDLFNSLSISEDSIAVFVFLVVIPAFIYFLQALYTALRHALELTAPARRTEMNHASDDLKLSLLADREILLALLAFHLPHLTRRLLWFGVLLAGIISALVSGLAESIGPVLAAIGTLNAVVSSLIAATLLILIAVQVRSMRISAAGSGIIAWLLTASQAVLAFYALGSFFDLRFYSFESLSLDPAIGMVLLTTLGMLVLFTARMLWAGISAMGRKMAITVSALFLVYSGITMFSAASLNDSRMLLHGLQALACVTLLFLLYTSSFLLSTRRFVLRLLLYMLPVIAAFLATLRVVLIFEGASSSVFWMEELELIRTGAVLLIGNVYSIQHPVFWSDFSGKQLPMFEWWRWPLHIIMQFLLLSVLHRAALTQIAAWRNSGQ